MTEPLLDRYICDYNYLVYTLNFICLWWGKDKVICKVNLWFNCGGGKWEVGNKILD